MAEDIVAVRLSSVAGLTAGESNSVKCITEVALPTVMQPLHRSHSDLRRYSTGRLMSVPYSSAKALLYDVV